VAWTRAAALGFVALLLAGCVAGGPSAPQGAASSAAAPRPTVVALLDTGILPYHAAFAGNVTTLARLPGGAYTEVNLSTSGSLSDREAADDATWSSLKTGQLYHFAGTRLLAMSFLNASNPLSPGKRTLLDTTGHGTETASLAAQADPEAILVLLQIGGQVCAQPDCLIDPSIAEAVRWAAAQPWIDAISMSLAVPANAPDSSALHKEKEAFLEASREASRNGKLIFGAAGNEPEPTLAGYTNGPPWIVCVGGYEPANDGESAYTAKGVDVLGNFTAQAADYRTLNGTHWVSGTSYATPLVAGTVSRALGIVRAAGGAATPKALRDALNLSAVALDATGYDPLANPQDDPTLGHVTSPALPVVSPTQEGWGWVHAGLAPQIAQRVLRADASVPPEKATIATAQAAWQAQRESYWSSALSG